jgi:fucose permease
MSIISHKSLKNLPIQALLERDPATAEEDCMDLMEFFSGPPELGVQRAGAFNSAGEPSSPRLGVGHLDGKSHDGKEDQTGTKNESPASTDTMGAPLMTAPTRVSQRGNTWSVLTSPIRWVTNQRAPVDQTQQPTQRFFDVVHMGRRRPLTELTAREAWWPIMFISILFFLWGFSYGLLGNLNSQIMTVIPDSTPSKNIALQNAYWLGYIIGPTTVGAYTLTKHGFKVTFMTGLVIYGCATMCFWPSSVLASYGGFVFCNILVGMGLSVLEVAANPFIALAGPGELSEARLNFSQGIQAVASIVSPILAQKVFFRRVDGRISLFDIQWCYLAVALFVLFLALVFFYVPLSEASDDELETLAVERLDFAGLNLGSRAFSSNISARWFLICGGCAVMMLYCGAQESISYFWNQYITTIASSGSCSPFWDITIAHSLFAASRFIAAGLCYMGMPPRLILNVCLGSTFLTTLLAVVLPDGNGAYACIQLALFFEGPVFPTLFAMALRGQGRRTKQASIALTASIGLAVIWQSSTWAIYQRTHDVRHAFILVAVMCGVQALYSLALNASSVLRRFVDPKWSLHGGDRPAGRQSISQHVVGAETPAMTEKDYHRAPLSMTRSISAHRDEKERFETGIQSQNEKDVKGKEGHLVVVAARSARSSSGDSGSGDSEPPSPNPSTVTTGPGSGPSPPAGHVRRHSAYDYSSAAVPALARVPEEAAGPTDDFAGIGVVGELPDI